MSLSQGEINNSLIVVFAYKRRRGRSGEWKDLTAGPKSKGYCNEGGRRWLMGAVWRGLELKNGLDAIFCCLCCCSSASWVSKKKTQKRRRGIWSAFHLSVPKSSSKVPSYASLSSVVIIIGTKKTTSHTVNRDEDKAPAAAPQSPLKDVQIPMNT